MALIPTIDYFSRDWDSLRSDMLQLIPFFTPEWTDRNPNDLGVVLIELFAYMGDITHFYIDRRAQDLYLPTAFTRQSVVNMLKLIDYNVPGKQAATADELFTITDSPYDEVITVPRATKLEAPAGTGGTPVKFETLDEYLFAYTTLTATVIGGVGINSITVANSLEFTVGDVVNLRDDVTPAGETLTIESIPDSSTIVFTGDVGGTYTAGTPTPNARVSAMAASIPVQEGTTYNEGIGTSDGIEWQIIAFSRLNIIEGSIEIIVDEGTPELWTEIESLGYATPGQKVYELSRNFEGYVTVRFGDGILGKIPNTGATISSIYRVGGGIGGNVGADTITRLLDVISSTGGPVNFTVTNPVQSSGGAEEQSIDNAKLLGPKSLRALGRAVTLEDYATLARTVTGVREANAVRRGSALYREIDVYIVPEGGYVPTNALITAVQVYLQARAMAGETVYVQGPTHVVGLLITATVHILPTYDAEDIQIAVESVLSNFFDVDAEGTQFGRDVNLSDIMALIDNVTGVDYVDVAQLTLDPASTLTWEISPDDPAVASYIVGLNTLALIDQTYTITFTNPTTYTVKNGLGVHVGTGTLSSPGVELATTDGALRMMLVDGTDAMVAGDRATFRTSQYIGNVEIDGFEIRQLDTQTLSFEGGA